jgi:hypothetical protein
VRAQPAPTVTESHDESGNLHLSYSIPLSNSGLEPTQVDSSSLRRRYGVYSSVENTQQTQPPSEHAADPVGQNEPIELDNSSVAVLETARESFETVPSTAPEDLVEDEEYDEEKNENEKNENEEEDTGGKDREDEEYKGGKDGGEDEEDDQGKDGEGEEDYDQDKAGQEEEEGDNHMDGPTGFPLANRFGGADSQLSTPAKSKPNPLAHLAMGIGAGTGLSMTQVFDAESSPMDRTRTIDSQPPPTPSYAAAKMMARSMPLAPTVWDDYSSPARRDGRGTTEPPEFPRLANFEDTIESPLRPHKSPALFSSPPVRKTPRAVKSDWEDDIFSESQERRIRLVAKINAGSAKKKPQFQKSTRPNSAGVNALTQVKPPKKKSSREFEKPTKTAAKRVVVIDDDDDETGDDTAAESQGQPVLPQRRSSRDEGVKASNPAIPAPTTQVPASPPLEHPLKQLPPKPQPPPPPLDTAWDELHAPPQLPARSNSYSHRRRTQASPEAVPRHTNSMPVDLEAAPAMTRTGSGQDPVSLSQLVPFNVPMLPPTPPKAAKAVPEFERELSELIPLPPVQVPCSSLTPNPSSPGPDRPSAISRLATLGHMVPETSPLRPEGGSPKKRRRGDDVAEIHRPQSELKSFAALNSSQPVLSGVEDPDEVDMIDIVEGVGAGKQADLEMPAPAPSIQKGRATKKRKTSVNRSVVVEEPHEEAAPATEESAAAPELPRLPSSSPPPVTPIPTRTARKSRASTGRSLASKVTKTASQRRRTSTRQTPASMASPTPMVMDCDDDTDILTSNHPAFTIAPSPGGPITAPDRVFALFKDQHLQYHPASIDSKNSQGGKIRVIFDDCSSSELEPHCIRSLDLRVGDIIRVDLPHMKKGTWVIRGFPVPTIGSLDDGGSILTDIRGHSVVAVAPKNSDPSVRTQEIMVTSIYLIKSLWSQFAGRHPITRPPTTPAFLSNATNTPARRTSSTPVNPAPAGIFTGMVFALTFGDSAREKSLIETKLLTHGARILNIGFEELFHDIDSSPHLTLLPSSQALGFTAVIANGFSRRAKFLQALALGLPCLAARWVEDCVKKGTVLDWEYYLLPAGESKYLGGVVRSRTLLGTDPVTAKLQDIATRKRIFEGWDVLAVAKGMAKEKMVPPVPPTCKKEKVLTGVESVYVFDAGGRCGAGGTGEDAGCGG